MNFFKAVFSDDPDPPTHASESPKRERPSTEGQQGHDSDSPHSNQSQPSPRPDPDANPNPTSRWDFGGLIKTLTTKSESVIETYRRDLHEFGSGLRKEIEVAQGSLGTVGTAIDEFGSSVIKGTAQIISQSKEAILSVDLNSDNSSDGNDKGQSSGGVNKVYRRYSRFDAQVRAIQGDVSTYCDEPEDMDDYNKWKLKFDFGKKEEEIGALFDENAAMRSVYEKVVPSNVDHSTFWCRYFYRVHKLELAENFRAKLVKSAISSEEEELSWDVYDEEEEEKNTVVKEKGDNVAKPQSGEDANLGRIVKEKSAAEAEEKNTNVKETGGGDDMKKSVANEREDGIKEDVGNAKVDAGVASAEKNKDITEESGHSEEGSGKGNKGVASESDKNVASSTSVELGKPSKNSDSVAVSGKPTAQEEEDLGWDEIEDLSSIDDQKVTQEGSSSPKRAELRKRLSGTAVEEEEDLSWDIEDDDEPSKN